MSIQLQPPVPLVSLVTTEPPTVIKNEPPEEEISTDIKEIDIVYHPLCEDLIKSETVLEDILENKHLESVQTQALVVKAENYPFIKTETITQRNKSEGTSDENISNGTGQGVVEVEGLNEYFNTLDNLETNEQLVPNFSSDLNGIKAKHSKKTDVDNTLKTTAWKKDKEKIKVIEAPKIPVEPHEYTSLAKDNHVCNHCQRACNSLNNIKRHIKRMHRKVIPMYQCPYCPYKSKSSVREHIIAKHKSAKDIQWFQCHLCEKKYKLKRGLVQHMNDLTHEQMQDSNKMKLCPVCGKGFTRTCSVKRHMKFVHNKEQRNKEISKCRECEYRTTERQLLERHIQNTHKNYENRYYCDQCGYETDKCSRWKIHKLIHWKKIEERNKEKIQCQECEYSTTESQLLKLHVKNTHKKHEKRCHYCDKCDFITYHIGNLKKHELTHLKPEEIQYFYCYHCSYKSKRKSDLKIHILRHDVKNVKRGKRHDCDKCDYKTYQSTHLNRHNLVHLKPREIEYFYCYHCSYKSKYKGDLKQHIFRHFKKEQVEFDCYICNFMTLKRESIIKHIKKHSKVQNKSEINEGS